MSLYKYVGPERIDIIKNETIRFTQPTAFNDPFDTSPNFTALADDKLITEYLEENFNNEENLTKVTKKNLENEFSKYGVSKEHPLFESAVKQLKGIIQTQGSALFSSITKLQYPSIKKTIFKKFTKNIGILSLSEKPDNILMWGHYADSHKGFVIEFDKKHSFFDQRKKNEIQGYIRKVIYGIERPELTLYDSSLTDEEIQQIWIEKLFWFKSIDWQYEKEWRIIYAFQDKKDIFIKGGADIFLFSIPIDCVKSIIFGCKMSDENKKQIRNLLKSHEKYYHIQIFQAVEDEKKFKINICKIKEND